MDASFVKAIADLRAASERPIVRDGDGRRFFMRKADGTLLEFESPPPPIDAYFEDVDSFSRFISTRVDDEAIVYVGEGHAICQLDQYDRADRATLRFSWTAQAAAVQRICSLRGAAFEVRDAFLFVKVELGGARVPPSVLASLRRIDFEKKTSAHAGAAAGMDTLGRSVEAGVVAPPPETFPLSFSPFTIPDFPGILLQVDMMIDALEEKVVLRVDPDHFARMMLAARVEFADVLRKAMPNIPVYVGEP